MHVLEAYVVNSWGRRSSWVVQGTAIERENKRKSKDPRFAPLARVTFKKLFSIFMLRGLRTTFCVTCGCRKKPFLDLLFNYLSLLFLSMVIISWIFSLCNKLESGKISLIFLLSCKNVSSAKTVLSTSGFNHRSSKMGERDNIDVISARCCCRGHLTLAVATMAISQLFPVPTLCFYVH